MNIKKFHSSDALTRLSEIQFIEQLGPEDAALCIDAITTNVVAVTLLRIRGSVTFRK